MHGDDNEAPPPRRRYRWATSYDDVKRHKRRATANIRDWPRRLRSIPRPGQVLGALRSLASRDRPAAPRGIAVVLLVALGLASLCVAFVTGTAHTSARRTDVSLSLTGDNRQRDTASRSENRAGARPATPASGAKAPAPAAASPASGKAAPVPAAPAVPVPVGGLDRVQMGYARTIVSVGKQMGLPKQAYVIAIATALQESKLYNLANGNLGDSLNLAHDGVGYDYDSVGLFQQRPSSGWGSIAELMNPAISARRFYNALMQVAGWQNMPVTVAAQTVQGSAFPDAYAQHEALADLVVNALS